MSDDDPQTDPEGRAKYIKEYAEVVNPHHDRAWEYDKQALEIANNGFRAVTYLNGGALVAIPTAAAFFKAELASVRFGVIAAALCFIAGLLLVVIAQVAGFYDAREQI